MPRKAAFFDVDGTLIKGLIICAFPDYLAGRGFFDKKKNERIQELTHLYGEGKISYRYASVRIPKLYAAGIKGQKQSEIMELASAFLREYSKNVFPYSKGLVSLFKRNGFLTIAVSGSPIEAVTPLNMDFREIQGTEMEVRNGVYTGKVKRNLILAEEKRKVITSLIKKYNIDMKSSFAFGDTEQDLPMLGKVGHPVPLNPAPLLRKHALKKGWCIPKDVLKEVKEML
jgi:HAD superfamily hydrolase (TIGR01490 family)